MTRGARICFDPIGTIVREGPAPESIEALRAQPVRVDLRPELADATLGLAPGSDILVVAYFHLASRDVLQVHPRGDPSRPLRGVFATRSPVRPNPIAVTTARVLAVSGVSLTVVGLDALDGTPVLDIKHASEAFDLPYDDRP